MWSCDVLFFKDGRQLFLSSIAEGCWPTIPNIGSLKLHYFCIAMWSFIILRFVIASYVLYLQFTVVYSLYIRYQNIHVNNWIIKMYCKEAMQPTLHENWIRINDPLKEGWCHSWLLLTVLSSSMPLLRWVNFPIRGYRGWIWNYNPWFKQL